MPIRLYSCAWSYELEGGLVHLTHPIGLAVEGGDLPVTVTTVWPRPDADGLPVAQVCLCVVEGGVAAQAALAALPDVRAWRAHDLRTPVAEIDIDDVLDNLEAEGLPRALYAGAQTWGDILAATIRAYRPDWIGWGAHTAPEAFA